MEHEIICITISDLASGPEGPVRASCHLSPQGAKRARQMSERLGAPGFSLALAPRSTGAMETALHVSGLGSEPWLIKEIGALWFPQNDGCTGKRLLDAFNRFFNPSATVPLPTQTMLEKPPPAISQDVLRKFGDDAWRASVQVITGLKAKQTLIVCDELVLRLMLYETFSSNEEGRSAVAETPLGPCEGFRFTVSVGQILSLSHPELIGRGQ